MIALLFCSLISVCFSETCPTRAEIKAADIDSNQVRGWYAFDVENGTPRTLESFSHALEFALAEWMVDAPEGEAHCYYGPTVDAYLAKHDLKPDLNQKGWIRIGNDEVFQCSGNTSTCSFS